MEEEDDEEGSVEGNPDDGQFTKGTHSTSASPTNHNMQGLRNTNGPLI